jgi:hypothetical protein
MARPCAAAAGNAVLAASDLVSLLLPHASGDWSTDAASASSVAVAAAAAAVAAADAEVVDAVAAPLGGVMQVDSFKTRVESAYRFSA